MSVHDLIAPRQCPLRHSLKTYANNPDGAWIRGDDELFVLMIQGVHGRGKYRMQCRQCGHRSSDVPKKVAEAWGLLDKDHPFDLVDYRPPFDYPACSYAGCVKTGGELHHFAPRNTFGEDADSWPVMPLCTDHHREWHTRMDGYRWHRRAAA